MTAPLAALSAVETLEALAHGLIDLDARDHPDVPGLSDAGERGSLLPAYLPRAEVMLGRLWEAGYVTTAPPLNLSSLSTTEETE